MVAAEDTTDDELPMLDGIHKSGYADTKTGVDLFFQNIVSRADLVVTVEDPVLLPDWEICRFKHSAVEDILYQL